MGGLGMRTYLLGFMLSPILLLGQSPISQIGEVTVASLDVTSGSVVSSEHLLPITREFESRSFNPNQLQEMVERARYSLQREGYFKADVSLNDVRPIDLIGGTIAVTLAIKEGQQFHLQQIGFSGNKELPESQLRQQFEIADGDVFDVEQIRKGLEQLRRLYVMRGYINFTPVPNTEADEDRAAVTLKIDCDEGKQFHFGRLAVAGRELHPGDGERILAAWKTPEGSVYDGALVEDFWKDIAPFLPPGWKIEQHLEVRQKRADSYRQPCRTLARG
jgi:outer membrane protein assembly factor BamA